MHKTYNFWPLFFCLNLFCLSHHFEKTVLKSNILHEEYKISYQVDGQEVGRCCVVKLPLSFCVLHSGVIFPQFRKQGYGKNLLDYICYVLKEEGCNKIFIQPGPFEMEKNRMIYIKKGPQYDEQIQRLVRGYQKAGFAFAPKWLSKIASIMYVAMRIDENANYLMMK